MHILTPDSSLAYTIVADGSKIIRFKTFWQRWRGVSAELYLAHGQMKVVAFIEPLQVLVIEKIHKPYRFGVSLDGGQFFTLICRITVGIIIPVSRNQISHQYPLMKRIY